ncbi:hypothetical protein GGI23_000235 [Coemansia sp. RSA 2559]|nr:hypothetical protein GGI23_000235 [Coemansia sp. RSA 2559]
MAVLNKNGKQTSCMVAVMNMEAGFVAANCIDLMSDNSINKTSTYKVQFTPTGQFNTGFEVDLATSNITIHPYYDPKTLANNIAIVQYANTSDTYRAYIGRQASGGAIQVYARRAINATSNTWGAPVAFDQLSDDSNCTAGSPLYAANSRGMTCTSSSATSVENRHCSMPYGIVYSWNTTDSTVVASNLYSHSVVYGSSLCDSSTKALHYYTAMWTYLGFAYSVVGWPISAYWEGVTGIWNDKTINAMNPPGDTSVSGTTIISGDLYQVERDMADGSSASSEVGSESESEAESVSESGSATASDEVSQQPTHDTTGSSHSSNGLSTGAKVAIGVSVPMGVIIIAIGTAILVHIWKTKQQDKAWDPSAQALNLQEVALEMTVDEPYGVPPPYSPDVGAESNRLKQIEELAAMAKK